MAQSNNRNTYISPERWDKLGVVAQQNNLLDNRGNLSRSQAIAFLLDNYMAQQPEATEQAAPSTTGPAVERKDK